MAVQVFDGADVFDGERLHRGARLAVEDGVVVGVLPAGAAVAGEAVRLAGGILAPGMIDLQVNGGDGLMLGDAASVEGIARICAAHARLGTLGLLPTLITDTPDVTQAVVAAGVAAARAGVPGFLGLHLEGPHLDPRRKGAHDPGLIRPMAAADLALLLEAAAALPVLMVTLAPEAATAAQIGALAAAGVVVSLGHSDAGLERARQAFAAGARCATHLFNAMSPLGHREPGMVGAVLDTPGIHAGVICDGVHVAPAALRIALAAMQSRPPLGLFLVTDAMAVAGTEGTEFRLGGRRILRRDGVLTLDDGTLAGADCDLPGSVRRLVQQVGLGVEAALAMATSVPAACIGMQGRLGMLRAGRVADMVHLADDFSVRGVWRAGAAL